MTSSVAQDNDVATRSGDEVEVNRPRLGRDHRVDAMRGVALLMMCVDHIPQNLLNRFTMRNVGFADAAEVFVLLAGYASLLAYGRGAIDRHGWWEGISRIWRRCVKLYVFQTALLAVMVMTIRQWRHFWPVPVDFLEPELAHGTDWLVRVLTLNALPSNLNILPLYMVLLLLFPVIYALIRIRPTLALGISAALWLLINIDPSVNFPNWLDPDGWYFDPFAWQFLFTLGACAAVEAARHNGNLPRNDTLIVLAWAYLAFSAVESFPWNFWGLPDLKPFGIASPEKTSLSPLRLLDVLAIFYIVMSSSSARKASEGKVGQFFALFGRHSLEVFSVGTVIDLFGRLIFTTFGSGMILQVLVNGVGLAILYGTAFALDSRRKRLRAQARGDGAARQVPQVS